tara:strand:+ start:322 stop:471 length:150 start_codon:yes stop_codon:yes gene_type:complete
MKLFPLRGGNYDFEVANLIVSAGSKAAQKSVHISPVAVNFDSGGIHPSD